MKLAELAHPYESTIAAYKSTAADSATTSPPREDPTPYLRLVDSIVRHFESDQDSAGAIIDRYTGRERYYSTPSYALGAALLVSNGADDLLGSAELAMTWASETLASGTAADQHPDFYTVLIVAADRLIADVASKPARHRWRAAMRRIEPGEIYQFHDQQTKDIQNWNVINLTGEYLRHSRGLGGNSGWWTRHLPYHLARFADNGLYRDGSLTGTSHPLAYDAIARYNLSVLLDSGYDGEYAPALRRSLVNGALTSLLIQSPTGDWMSAGRSSHHMWNEAALAATYEWAAGQLLGDEPELAGACKRGARLAVDSIAPWRRPGGDLSIVRNRYEPEERHGYEPYSNHTNYNLWTAAALSFAYLFADETIPEQPSPSTVGAYAVNLGEDFHQVVAASGGMQIVVDTLGDPTTNPTGLVRINRAGCNPQVGPSDGAVAEPRYSVLGTTSTALAHAPAWRDRTSEWHSLAAYGDVSHHLRPARYVESESSGDLTTLRITWYLASHGCHTIRAEYRVEPQRVHIRYDVTGPVTGLRAEIPLFESDGEREAIIKATDDTVRVLFDDTEQRVHVATAGATLCLTEQRVATRTGWLRHAYAECEGTSVDLTVDMLDKYK